MRTSGAPGIHQRCRRMESNKQILVIRPGRKAPPVGSAVANFDDANLPRMQNCRTKFRWNIIPEKEPTAVAIRTFRIPSSPGSGKNFLRNIPPCWFKIRGRAAPELAQRLCCFSATNGRGGYFLLGGINRNFPAFPPSAHYCYMTLRLVQTRRACCCGRLGGLLMWGREIRVLCSH